MRPPRPSWRLVVLTAAAFLVAACLSGCSVIVPTAPRCTEVERVATTAQSVPVSSYVPCIASLPAGWSTDRFLVRDGGTTFTLHSDRSPGHPVSLVFRRHCSTRGATPLAPRTPGGRTYISLLRISPRYTGSLFDVFPGGCVTYEFDFPRDAHIALMADLQTTVGFVSRADLRRRLRADLHVRLR